MYLTDIADETPPPSVPCPYQPRGRSPFPLRQLEVGDGFGMVGGYQDAKKLRQATRNAQRGNFRRFLVRKIDVGYWCCWRLQ